jgi:hypothetical protein
MLMYQTSKHINAFILFYVYMALLLFGHDYCRGEEKRWIIMSGTGSCILV